jgi:hypothetical protein
VSDQSARFGWESDFPRFRSTPPSEVRERLESFISDASPEQIRAWKDSIPPLQSEVGEVLLRDELAKHYSAILEYELPLESRRPDVLLLVGEGVLVIELKGKLAPSQADIDQAAGYARDLRCYHRECWDRPVTPVLVPTRARGYLRQEGGVHIAGPDAIDALVGQLTALQQRPVIDRAKFLDQDAYCPLPKLVDAARELFKYGELRTIKRARAATGPAVEAIASIIHEAAATKSRHLILVTGVPGSGKTLVGLQTVHAHYLDDLAVPRANGRPTTPAVFLSGNGPLVEVLQYELSAPGGGGKVFVRGVKDYVTRYSSKPGLIPPEHVLVFDEAQRAFDAEMVAVKHAKDDPATVFKSEPEHFVEFSERIPDWCVVVGLIGGGQEIHVGEEAGLIQWRWAVERSERWREWTIHAPLSVEEVLTGTHARTRINPTLNLDTGLRYHQADEVHRLVERLLNAEPATSLAPLVAKLEAESFHFRLTRSLDCAKAYLRSRYAEDTRARFGIIASSKDKSLVDFGIPNDFQATKNVRLGRWYGEDEQVYGSRSCRLMEACVTEFGAQGLELDASLLAWGTDLAMRKGRWSDANARGYRLKGLVKDAFQLRLNAYRVLLTRGRDACVVFVPPLGELDETYEYLEATGFTVLKD